MPLLLQEDNVVSLRTAYVHDGGDLVSFGLNPADMISLILEQSERWAPKDFEWMLKDSVWLYRKRRSHYEEQSLIASLARIEKDIRPLAFESPPQFRLIWADSGHSVALYLNGEPWAFIDEATREGYSKGILTPEAAAGKLWDQQLFERLFRDAPGSLQR